MTSKTISRYGDIARGSNSDSSDEYYTLYPAFMSLLLEVICRYKSGIKYKVIICPCDSQTSIFRELVHYKDIIGNPKIIYSFWPEKDWKDYFNLDYEREYGCKAEEVLIFTNPPFKGLSQSIPTIECDYLLFGSNAVGITGNTHMKETKIGLYRKNNLDYDGNADNFTDRYGRVATLFYSNREFLSTGKQYINTRKSKQYLMFGKNELKRIK